MTTNIIMPKMGMHMTEGVVIAWLVPDGTQVASGDVVLEVENDKVTNEVEAPVDGRLEILVAAGTTCAVGTVLGRIGAGAESEMIAPSAPASTVRRVAPYGEAEDSKPLSKVRHYDYQTPPVVDGVRASPIARRMATEMGIDLRRIVGSGPRGRITERDIIAYREIQPDISPQVGMDALSPMRRRIADRMTGSLLNTAQFTLTAWADAGQFVRLRDTLRRRWQIPLGYTDMLVKAAAVALQNHSTLAVRWEGERITVADDLLNIGVAVALDEGLVVPVIRNVHSCTLPDIHHHLTQLTRAAHASQLSVEEMSGGHFTISNLGMAGIAYFTPILNPPEAAILGVGSLDEVAVFRNGQVQPQLRLPLSLTVDHRLIDGLVGAQFLRTLVEVLETPALLFTGL